MQSLNNLHRHYAKQYPGHFSFNEDYIYTLCYEGAMMHRLKLSIGMPGYDEKLQTATWGVGAGRPRPLDTDLARVTGGGGTWSSWGMSGFASSEGRE